MELSVCLEIVYNETARCSDYVLPCLSYMESYDTVCFNYSYPDLYFHMKQPVLEPLSSESREGSRIIMDLIKAMGFLPEFPQSLYDAGKEGISAYLGAMGAYVQENPSQPS
jgi:anaerobic selenocysteine-containing dehydrogenase